MLITARLWGGQMTSIFRVDVGRTYNVDNCTVVGEGRGEHKCLRGS